MTHDVATARRAHIVTHTYMHARTHITALVVSTITRTSRYSDNTIVGHDLKVWLQPLLGLYHFVLVFQETLVGWLFNDTSTQKGQFVPTAGEGNQLSRLRMANKI